MAVVITEQTCSSVKKIDFGWATTGSTGGTTLNSYDGEILRVLSYASGTTGGTLTIADEDGYDILRGQGAFTSGESYLGTTDGCRSPISAVAGSTLAFTVTVASTGTGGEGHCIVYIR